MRNHVFTEISIALIFYLQLETFTIIHHTNELHNALDWLIIL